MKKQHKLVKYILRSGVFGACVAITIINWKIGLPLYMLSLFFTYRADAKRINKSFREE